MADGSVPGMGAARPGPKPRTGPRGRMTSSATREEVLAALGDLPLQRDLLIEHMHALQDRHHCLRAGHLVALADLLRGRMHPMRVMDL